MEKFGKNLELLLEQNPAKDEDQENPENGREPLVGDDDQNVNVVVNQVEETMNNTTRLNRKRPLFSQTCNTLLEDEEQGNSKESPVRNSNVPKTPIAGKITRCGNLRIFLPFKFCVKSNLVILRAKQTTILAMLEALNFDFLRKFHN